VAGRRGWRPGIRRVGPARRFRPHRAGEPALLLLDEPLTALDAQTRLDVQSELRQHLADFAGPCLLVTHDPLEALVLADRLLVLRGGQIVQNGTPAEVARRPATDYVAKLVGLNLYAGRADGLAVMLGAGGSFPFPASVRRVTCSWRCALRHLRHPRAAARRQRRHRLAGRGRTP
jgi:molybdate transport system ATP-binding protein